MAEEKLSGLKKYQEELKVKKATPEQTETKETKVETAPEKTVSRKNASYPIINGIEVNPDKQYVFKTVVTSPTRRHITLGAVCKIYDTTLDQPRTIRYISTSPSVFDDEIPEAFKLTTDPYVGFYNNEFIVQGDVRLIEYLLLHDKFAGNPKPISPTEPIFYLANKEVLEAQKAQQFSKEEMALDVINKLSEEKLKPIARIVFNITDEDFGHIKNRLKEIVKLPKYGSKSGADAILDNIDNPRLERKYVLQTAMDKGLIMVNADKNNAVWGDTKSQICKINNVKDTARQIEELTDYSLTPAGEKFFDLVKAKV